MCLPLKHVELLEQTNYADYEQGRVSFETFFRFRRMVAKCHACALCDNGAHGDTASECRFEILRIFVSMKRDSEEKILGKRESRPISSPSCTQDKKQR